jgi:molybdate transport system substrate-binding protein
MADRPLTVLCTLGLAGVMAELGDEFERAVGGKLDVRLGPTAALAKDIAAGAAFDVAILTAPAIDDLAERGIIAGPRVDVASTRVGVTVAPGAPHPDIATVDTFKQALLAARRVCYTRNGASGQHFAKILPQLGIADAINAKALIIDGLVAERVIGGEADLGIQQISEIMAVPGSVMVGPIPDAVQARTMFSAGIGVNAANTQAAAALIRYLTTSDARAVATAKGLEPALA